MADDMMPLLIGFAVRATLVMAFAWGLTAAMRRASASARHYVWTCAIAASLLIPAGTLVAPRWRIESPVPLPTSAPPGSADARPQATPAASDSSPRGVSSQSAVTIPTPAGPSSIDVAGIVITVWAAGALGMLLYLAAGFVSAWHLRQRATAAAPASLHEVQALAEAFEIAQPIALVQADAATTPMVVGVWRPSIVMPPDVATWPDARRYVVLLHELAHIKRRDCLTQALANVVCAAYWFNPLAWIAARRLRAEREQACDDFVLAAGTRGSDYAGHLLEIAQASQPGRFSPIATAAVAMARRSQLEGRLMAILDPATRRSSAFYTRLAAAALVALVSIPVAAVHLVPPTSSRDVELQVVARPEPSIQASAAAPGAGRTPSATPTPSASPAQGRPAAQPAQRPAPEDAVRFALSRTLLEFADEGDVDGVSAMLAAGADVNAVIPGDGSPLIAAAEEGQLDVVVLLLNRGADPNLFVPGDGTALIAAAEEGHLSVVQLLLDKGADPNAIAPGDGTALIAAASEGHVSVVGLLLQRGAQVNLIAEGDETALIQASDEGYLDVVRLLVSRGADVNLGVWAERNEWDGRTGRLLRLGPELRTPLNRAREEGHRDVVTFLISAGARD